MRIELQRVGRRFGRVAALSDLDLAIDSGSRTAIIGPNGSGKSTMTRVVLGMLGCTGAVRLDGLDPYRDRLRLAPQLAYVPQVFPNLNATVREVVRAVASLRGCEPAAIAAAAGRLALDLEQVARQPFRSLSGGMRQKLLVALALASPARLIVLDEPTASMDPASRQSFYRLVEQLPDRPTVLLCSHRLEEIRHLVDQVVFLVDGRLQWQGPAAEYLLARSTSMLELRTDDDVDAAWLLAAGFHRSGTGWWTRTVQGHERSRLVQELTGRLGDRLRDIMLRDLEGPAHNGKAKVRS